MGDDPSMRLTRRRLLGGVTTIGVASAGVGVGTMAYWSDSGSSADNEISAGTFELTISGGESGDGATGEWTMSEAKPGDREEGEVALYNEGTTKADHVELAFDFDESKVGMTKNFRIDRLDYSTSDDLLADLDDANGNGIKDLDDLTRETNYDVLDNLTPPPTVDGGFKNLKLNFEWDVNQPNNDEYQGEQFTMVVTFALHQHESQDYQT